MSEVGRSRVGIEIDLLAEYPRTKRNVKERGATKTKADRALARKFGKEFFDMAFSMKDGNNSIAFETDAGWWIIRRLEYLPQKQLELSDPYRLGQTGTVQDYIAQLLAKQRESAFLQQTFSALFQKLRGQAEIKILGKP